jgi:DNA polymerase zeta
VFRGSQYRVESMMLRLTKPQNYVLISVEQGESADTSARPSARRSSWSRSSALYNDPVLVLDFQSLYPSIVIAYNLCFSTCLGRVAGALEAARKFGCDELPLPPGLLAFLTLRRRRDDRRLSSRPTTSCSCRRRRASACCRACCARFSKRASWSRAALKRAKQSGDRAAARMLDARQFGLKMIANVTYGYTSASFTGRMPCAELADSIVHDGARDARGGDSARQQQQASGTARRWCTATPIRCLCACRAPRSGARLRSASRSLRR